MAVQLVDNLLYNFKEERLNFLAELPRDITHHISVWFLNYKDQINFTLCNKYLHRNYGYYLYRYYCCGNCEAPLFHPQSIEFTKWNELNPIKAEEEITDISAPEYDYDTNNIKTEDGNSYILRFYKNDSLLLPLPPLKYKRSKLTTHIHVSSDISLLFDMELSNGLSQCFEELRESISFRILVMLYGEDTMDQIKSERLQIMVHCVSCSKCKLFLGFKINDIKNLKNDQDLCMNFRDNVLNRLIICNNYIRLVSLESNINHLINAQRIGVYCTGVRGTLGYCGNLLSFRDQMLSDEHCWSIDNKRENANYYNSMYRGSVECRDIKMIGCVQGGMMISKVFCSKCNAEIGWKFQVDQSELETRSHCNQNQYGRYGLVHSSITHRMYSS